MNRFFDRYYTSALANRAASRRKFRRRGSTGTELESLEPRLLLTIDSLAAIEGIIYDDLTNDGLTGDDVRQQNVQVELFRDGGDGLFNNGGGDDVSLGTQSTNLSGVYRFDDLSAGRYFASQDAIVGLIQRPGENVVTIDVSTADAGGIPGILIDAFDDPDPPPDPPHSVTVSSTGSLVDSAARLASAVVGLERDLSLELTSPTGGLSLNANAFNLELLEINSSTTAAGIGTVVWDGVDGDALTVDPTGLAGIDLTDAGLSTGVKLVAGIDQDGVTVTVRVHTDANNASEATTNVTNTGGPASDALLLPFSGFTQSGGATGPADFADVGAIELIIVGVTAADGQFGLVSSQGPLVKAANFANVQPVSLGNLVWNDINNNGQFDSGTENGIPAVTVELYSDTDGSGTFTAANDVFVTSVVTGGSGDYLFSNLLPGEYVVRIPQSEFDTGGDLETFSASSTGNGPAPDPDTNINNDDNGELFTGGGAVTQAVTLLGNTEPTDDGDLDSDTNLSVDFGFFQPIDLQISKVDSADPVNPGAAFAYTLTVQNNGPETATGVVATDSLPAGVSFVGGSATQGSVSESGGTVTASLGTLASGASATITINVTANNDTVGTITNNASVTGDQFDFVAGNNATSEPTTVTPVIDLTVTKTDSIDPVIAGGTLVYTVTVSNSGPSTATSVVLTDTLPAGVSFSSLTTSAGSASESGGVITGNLGTLASGASATVTITVDINNSTVGTITNNASVTATETELNNADNSTSEPTTVNPLVDVSVTKSDSADPVNAGSPFSYTVIVSNTGPSTASGVTLTDLLPAGVSYSSGTTTQGTIGESSGTVTASLGVLAAGASETVTIIVDVAGTTSGTITNNASVTSVETDSNATNNSTTEDTTIIPVVDLVVDKSDNPDAVNAGGLLTYTVLVTNNGPSPATSVVLSDILPTAVAFDSGSATQGTVTESSGTVTANLGMLASGASATVTILTTVADSASGTITNSTSVVAAETETNAANNSDTETTTVTPVIDLSITKTDDVDPVDAGGTLVYSLVVTNAGPSTATGVTVTDVIPGDVSFVSSVTTQGSVGEAGGVVTGNVGTLAPGASATVTITVTAAGTAVGTFTNNASVIGNQTDINTANNSVSEDTTINPVVDLVVTKSDSADPVNAGDSFAYTLTVTNNGPSSASGVSLTDLLPPEVGFDSGSASQGSVSESNGTVTASIGTLASGASATVTLNVTAADSARGTITNSTSVTANETETNAANNAATEPTTITPVVDVRISKSDSADPVNAGGSLTYTVTVTNDGPSTANSVVVTDILPTGVSFDTGSASQGTVTESGGTVTASVGTLASGASATITLNVDVDNSTSGTITNAVSVTSTETDTNSANNSDTEPTTIVPVVDLAITKSDSADPVNAGDSFAYTLTVTNNGPSSATGVTLTDLLPPEVSFDSGSASQGSVSESSGTVTASLGTLVSGASATVTLNVTAADSARGTITNSTSVTGNETETNAANNSATEPTLITPIVDVLVTKIDSIDPVNAGGIVVYSLFVRNDGPSEATGVRLTDILPSGVSFRSATSSQGSVSESSGTVTASLGTLASGANATVSLSVDIDDSTRGTLTNTTSVTSTETDTDTNNNRDSETTTVTPVVDLVIAKSDSADPVNAGGSFTYTLTVTNNGPSTATGVTVTDLLPAEVSFNSGAASQGSISESGGTVVANLGTLASGASATVTLNVTTANSARGTITNSASVTGNETETNAANNSATEPTAVTPVVDVRISKSDSADPVNAGGSLTYTVTVTNDGPSTANGVVVTDVLPAGVTFDTGSASQGTVTASSGTVTASVGTLASGASAIITLNVDVDNSASGTLTNTVSVTSTETDTNSANNTETEPTTIVPVVDLAITKSDSADPVNAGDSFAYTLTVTNNGPSTANGVTLTDLLPPEVSFDSGSASQGSVSESSGTVTASLGTLASGASATVTLNVTTANSARGTITNSASVTGNETETNAANNSATEPTVVTPVVDVLVTKMDDVDPVNADGILVYTMFVRNTGPSTATGVILTDVLPAGVSFRSASSSQGSVSETGGVVTANLGSVTSGAQASVSVSVDINDATTGTLTNTATVRSNEIDTTPSNNSDSESTTVTPVVDLSITKSDSVDPVAPNGSLVYTLQVTNNGPSNATGVVVTDLLPADVAFDTGSASQGSVSESAGTVTASLGNLASGASATVTLNVTVVSGASSFTNSAAVVATETETNSTNNTASEPTTVQPPISSLAGLVYIDANRNGQFDGADVGIPGVAVSLVPVDAAGGVTGAAITQVTDSSGAYQFTSLTAGRYRLVETQPSAVSQGSETIGTSGGTNPVPNVIDGIVLAQGDNATTYNFGEEMLSKRRFLASSGSTPTTGSTSTQAAVSGRVFSDANGNSHFDAGDQAIAGVTVSLIPIDSSGQVTGAALIAVSDANGVYRFSEVTIGRYRLIETQPQTHAQGVEIVGSGGGINTNVSDDIVDDIDLTTSMNAIGYDFAEGLIL